MSGRARVDFFVSYASADRPWAEWIASVLEEAGYSTRLQAWDFGPGANWVVEVDDATRVSARTLVVLSPAFLESRYVRPEWAAAFHADPEGRQRKLLPVRVRECHPDGLLGAIVYVDLVGLPEDLAHERLLKAVAGTPPTPAQPAAFPVEPSRAAVRRALPSGGPPIWNVPAAAGRFVGREALLRRLEERLADREAAGITRTRVLHGLGGVGKTRLAAEFARRHRADYDVVWWVRAEDAVTMAGDYAALADALGLPERDEQRQAVRVTGVTAWLETHNRWLLVFDNAPGPDQLRELMPRGSGGDALITSRRQSGWRGLADVFPVDVWTRGESVAFLRQRSGDADAVSADAIADALGDLPLALEQAGAYVDSAGLSLAGFRRRLASHAPALFERGRPADYEHTVATTWELAFAELERDGGCAALLFCCAFLAPDRIPRELFASDAIADGMFASAAGELALDDAVKNLLAFSLVTADETSVSMHRLVQRVIRQRLGEDRGRWLQTALRLLRDRFPADGDGPQYWSACEALLPHALVVCDHAGAGTMAAGELLRRAALYLHTRVVLKPALALYAQLLQILERTDGPDDPRVAWTLGSIGLVHRQLGALEEARRSIERALQIFEAAYGPDHADVAGTLDNLGFVLRQLGDLDGARARHERALQIFETVHGPGDPAVARSLGNIGLVLWDLGDLEAARGHQGYARELFETAIDYQQRAREIFEAACGPHHPDVGRTRTNLGALLEKLGDLEGAREHHHSALQIFEAAYGPDHPEVARTLGNLGLVLQRLGQQEASRKYQQRALWLFEVNYGPNHPEVARMLGNLGLLLQELGELQAACEHHQRALQIYEARFGPDHPNVARTRNNLTVVTQLLESHARQ